MSSSSAVVGASTTPLSTTTLITSVAIIVSSILGTIFVVAIGIFLIVVRRRIRARLEDAIARADFVPTVIITDPEESMFVIADDASMDKVILSHRPIGLRNPEDVEDKLPCIEEEEDYQSEEYLYEDEKAEFVVAKPDEIEHFNQPGLRGFIPIENVCDPSNSFSLQLTKPFMVLQLEHSYESFSSPNNRFSKKVNPDDTTSVYRNSIDFHDGRTTPTFQHVRKDSGEEVDLNSVSERSHYRCVHNFANISISSDSLL